MAKDTFNITMLYPTKTSGREWFSNWLSSTRRAFRNAYGLQYEFPVISGQNQDPQDAQFISIAGGPTSWYIDGTSGVATWKHESPATMDVSAPASCRPYVMDVPAGIEAYEIGTQVPPRQTWTNVEMTVYVRANGWAVSTDNAANNGSFVRLAGPNNHFNINNCNCDGVGYSINLLGYSDHAYAILMHKELTHDTYGNPSDGINVATSAFPKTPSWTRRVNNTRWPLYHWIGLKFVQRKITSSGYVKLEAYRDTQDGRFGGHWQKIMDLTDDGIVNHWGASVQATKDAMDAHWASTGNCSNTPPTNCIIPPTQNYNPLINTARHSCYLRIQNFYNVNLKKFSIREIDPIA